MKKRAYNSLIALSGGIFGFSVLYILFFFINPFIILLPATFLWVFLILVFNSFCEEGTKFLLIKKWEIGKFPYGFLLGFGWGGIENLMHFVARDTQLNPINSGIVIVLHIITAGIICYFVKKNKPILGLLIAIILHTGFNLVVHSVS